MAIPFYEPRHQHTTECDQVDGHFPPAPSSQSVALPTANPAMPVAVMQPAAASTSTNAPRALATGIATARAISSVSMPAGAIFSATSTSSSTVTTSTMTHTTEAIASNVSATSITTTSSHTVTSSYSASAPAAAPAIFSITASNPAISTFLPTNDTSTESTQTSSSPSAALASEPLPWKLLAVAMCKALKQYHQQTGSRDLLTKTVIEIVPSGGVGAQGPPSAAGN
ncbi:uncharacterized protein LOC128862109 [Anastrepha ludens]|uniref:uncharacterized protein LOC128862109 n=1 Tax=Anastrepha ludens TaxID=28586 RepID=UPI0023B144CF|nr:uncharacterized protein LOC128862109 [Anastrepha ludens]